MTTGPNDMTVGMGATVANSFAGWQAAVAMHRWREVLQGVGIEPESDDGALQPWSWWVARDGTVKAVQGFPTGTTGDDRRPVHSCRGSLALPETVGHQGDLNAGTVPPNTGTTPGDKAIGTSPAAMGTGTSHEPRPLSPSGRVSGPGGYGGSVEGLTPTEAITVYRGEDGHLRPFLSYDAASLAKGMEADARDGRGWVNYDQPQAPATDFDTLNVEEHTLWLWGNPVTIRGAKPVLSSIDRDAVTIRILRDA